MKNRAGGQGLTKFLAGVSSAAVFAAFCAPALADDTKAEIQALKAQLRHLEQKLEAQAQAQKKTQQEVEHVAHAKGQAGVISDVHPIGSNGDAPWPAKFYYKAVTITPGGFFEFATVNRDHYIGADIATPFQNIPYPASGASKNGETRFSPRRSRFTLKTDADLDEVTHATMYLATDFLGAGQTANLNQSDSFNFRFRELYTQVDRKDLGLHVSAGQAYSLIGLNSRGTEAATFLTPPVIDDQYMPGFTWARQPGVRISKEVTKDIEAAFAIENFQTTYIGVGTDFLGHQGPCLAGATAVVAGATCSGGSLPGLYNVGPVGGSLYNSLNPVTYGSVPDMIGKVAWDPTLFDRTIHVEVGGMLRNFTDRVFWGNHTTWGSNIEAGIIIPIIPKLLDFQFSGVSGLGNGRYGAAQINDATFTWSGGAQPIHERQVMVGVTAHPTPATDVYVFAGGEFASKNYTFAAWPKTVFGTVPGVYAYGYGNPAYNNFGCAFEGPTTATCVGQIKDVRQVTTGFWHNFYDGPAGKIRVGAQYSYTVKDSFTGYSGAYKGTENMFFTSLRYIPFN
ncbi:hypothetical protein [Methylocystis heyeri]|uniref:Porin n=1 Tax=Methylocystis heyeri TaxID=391905 RepID=A0A6B8KFJ2_9HYPH|nr:hypothetical protein [Methylocystis heyeri]QGM47096.1 hypothetical protein H2LOC_016140 [Methylocystis heyeri]